MPRHTLLGAALAFALLGSTGFPQLSYAQTTGGDAGGTAATSSGTDANSGGDASGGQMDKGKAAATCPDGTPMPADGQCPAATDQNGAAGSGESSGNASGGAATGNDTAAGSGSTSTDASGSGTTTDNGTKAGGSGAASGSGTTSGDNTTTSGSSDNGSTASSGGSSSASADVNITTEQKTTIVNEIKTENVQPVQVNFNISIGVAVPHEVHLVPLPARIVKIVPHFKGFLFFLLPDGRIVIVNPNSLKVVFILVP